MRILFVKRLYQPIGGSESLTYHLATGLVSRGHDVRVACMWPPQQDRSYRVDRFHPSEFDGYRVFRDKGVEVVQVRPRGGILGAAADWTALLDLMRMDVLEPYARDRDVIHNVCRESIESAIEVAQRVGAASVLTPIPHPGQFHGGDTPADIRNYSAADAICALTDWERRWYAREGLDITRVVTTGLGSTSYPTAPGAGAEFRRRHRIPPEAPLVLFIGRKERYKGYIQLLDATELVWREFPEARFVFIGVQGWYSTFVDDFARYRDERILDLGSASSDSKRAALEACDVFAMPSIHESFGIVFLEAWSFEKPVIAGDIPTSHEIVTHGVDGLCVQQRGDRVAAAILTLLRDPALRTRMGKAGRLKAQRYSWESTLDRTEATYRIAVEHKRGEALERATA
ncbi:MAG: glycosyltransferase family 4 protein [Chloroflexi bacterium]|nr:MAG: glycosyltransferase family 4 protein [Chloroflexota bacterium]